MNILTVDFETYYSQSFSLTKLTTEQYVRDDQFEVIGVAVAKDDEGAVWFSGSHDEIAQWFPGVAEEIRQLERDVGTSYKT